MVSLRPTAVAATVVVAAGFAIAAPSTAAAASPVAAHSASSHSAGSYPPRSHQTRHAVFVQDDNPAGNAVVAYSRSASGALTKVGSYATGGRGGVLSGSVVDHLASLGSVGYDGGLLVAVNAGSNTITTFAVEGDHLRRLQVLPAGGSFPVSVAIRGDQVFVLDARGGGAIQGYLRIGARLELVPAWHRSLGLDPNQTPEFTSTPGQIGFTPDGRRLVVTTKNGGNSVLVYNLGLLGPSRVPVVTDLPGTVPFGFSFDRDTLVLTEAGTNSVATFRISDSGHLQPIATAATGQSATCWVVVAGDHAYASNAGSGTLSGYRIGRFGTLHASGTTATDAGTVDAAASPDGRFVYAETGGAGIVDAFRVGARGTLIRVGSVTVPDAVGAEGIVVR